MIDELRTRLAEAEAELEELRTRQRALQEREAALTAFVDDGRAAVASFERLEREQQGRRLPRAGDLGVDQLVAFLRDQAGGVVAVDELVARYGAAPSAIAELARRRAAQGRIVYDATRGLVKLL